MIRRRVVWLAAVLSCLVYLVPLVGRHGFWFLGASLARGLMGQTREPVWLLAEMAFALGLQAAAGVVWYWILRRPRSLRWLVLVVAVPAAVIGANWVTLLVLPTWFLIERDTAPERRSWPLACSVPGQTLAVLGWKPAVVRAPGDPLAVQDAAGRVARVTLATGPDGTTRCDAQPLAGLSPDANFSPVWIDDNGRALLSRIDRPTGALSWEWIAASGAAAVPLVAPPGRRPRDPPPVISRDGRAVAWLIRVPASGQPPASAIVIRALPDASGNDASPPASEIVITLDDFERGRLQILDVNLTAGEVLVAINERRFAAVGFDGGLRWGPVRPDGVDPLATTFRRLGDGWVAWDGYREQDAYVIAWQLSTGRGAFRVPRGRGVTDVAVHSGGQYIAVSVTTTLSVGDVPDAVVVVRASDGAEVFRRILPRYARSAVAFPAPGLFAYTEWDGSGATVTVLRLPPG